MSLDAATTAIISPKIRPSWSLSNIAKSAVAAPAIRSRTSALFRGEVSKTSAAKTRSRARKYAGCWEIAEVSRKKIGHAANWLTGATNERSSISLSDMTLRSIMTALDRKGDPTISTASQFYFFYCVSVRDTALSNLRMLSLKVPLRIAILTVVQLLSQRQLTTRQPSLHKPYVVGALDSPDNRVPHVAGRHILLKLITHRCHSLLDARYVPVGQLDPGHLQHPPEDSQIRSHQDTAVVEDGPPPHAPSSPRDLPPLHLDIVDRLKLGADPETPQTLDRPLGESLKDQLQIIVRYERVALLERDRIVQITSIMIDSSAPGKTADDLCPRLLARVIVDFEICGLEAAQYDRVGVVPEPDGVRSSPFTDGSGNGLLHAHVHERIITILCVYQPPSLYHHSPTGLCCDYGLDKISG